MRPHYVLTHISNNKVLASAWSNFWVYYYWLVLIFFPNDPLYRNETIPFVRFFNMDKTNMATLKR